MTELFRRGEALDGVPVSLMALASGGGEATSCRVAQHTQGAKQEGVRLIDLARVIRSKNAGPTQLTLDLFFGDAEGYRLAASSPALHAEAVADLYGVAHQALRRFDLPSLLALKFSLPRAVCAGAPGDGDVYGAQQHGPLLEVRV